MKILIPGILICSVLLSCISANAQDKTDIENILVMSESRIVPRGFEHLGTTSTVGSIKGYCGYDRALAIAKEEALKKGGNILKIRHVMLPDVSTQCYRILADIYKTKNIDEYRTYYNGITDSMLRLILPDTSSYSLLYIYRPGIDITLSLPKSFGLHIDNKEICSLNNGEYCIAQLTKTGKTIVWSKAEKKDELEIDVEPGKVYFIRCAAGAGVVTMRPKLELAEPSQGLDEYQKTQYAGK